ncbi:MAG: glycosyltransferase family 2 protein [Verrucomicrobiota bacterium JB022]|nr:glycosyltransferase family 2 protein [Verrucomicrobiota bacterium JB022]
MKFSVIICAHNPRPEFLQRTIDGLRGQTLPLGEWEFILVDNASDQPLADRFDLAWHPNGKVVVEPKLGLTAARICGFRQAQAPLVVMVDDDNVLSPDYLEQGFKLLEQFPQMGAISGRIEPEFEAEPAEEVRPFVRRLAICLIDKPEWGNIYEPALCPCGAGMILRQEVALEFIRQLENSQLRQSLDRKGKDLASSGDTDIAFCSCDLGYGIGRFPQLRAIHLMPAGRVQKDYLLRLVERGSETEEMLLLVRGIKQPSKGRELNHLLEELTSPFLLKGFTAKVRHASAKGKRRGLLRYRKLKSSGAA